MRDGEVLSEGMAPRFLVRWAAASYKPGDRGRPLDLLPSCFGVLVGKGTLLSSAILAISTGLWVGEGGREGDLCLLGLARPPPPRPEARPPAPTAQELERIGRAKRVDTEPEARPMSIRVEDAEEHPGHTVPALRYGRGHGGRVLGSSTLRKKACSFFSRMPISCAVTSPCGPEQALPPLCVPSRCRPLP